MWSVLAFVAGSTKLQDIYAEGARDALGRMASLSVQRSPSSRQGGAPLLHAAGSTPAPDSTPETRVVGWGTAGAEDGLGHVVVGGVGDVCVVGAEGLMELSLPDLAQRVHQCAAAVARALKVRVDCSV